VILGAGGHAKVVIDVLIHSQRYELAGVLSETESEKCVLGVAVLGTDDLLPLLRAQGVSCAFAAVGDNRIRKRLLARLTDLGYESINVIGHGSIVSSYARLGQGLAILPGAVVNAGAVIHDGAILNTACSVDHDSVIGVCAHVAPGAHIAGCVSVGEGVLIGTGASVIPNVTIGAWTTVGAGSTVVCDLPANETAVGVPARVLGRKKEGL
jgi:UDP-perosamine 4-acetyltransferase